MAIFGAHATGRAWPLSDIAQLTLEPVRLSCQQHSDLRDSQEASELLFKADIVESRALAGEFRERVLAESLAL